MSDARDKTAKASDGAATEPSIENDAVPRLKGPTWGSTRSKSRVSLSRRRSSEQEDKLEHTVARALRLLLCNKNSTHNNQRPTYGTTNSRTRLTTDSGASTSNSTNPSLYLRE
jgi:hypothetical protein